MTAKRFAIVYQCGIANVFDMTGGRVRQLWQGTFHDCEQYMRGACAAGAAVEIYHCDIAGDIALQLANWKRGTGDLWADKKCYA